MCVNVGVCKYIRGGRDGGRVKVILGFLMIWKEEESGWSWSYFFF